MISYIYLIYLSHSNFVSFLNNISYSIFPSSLYTVGIKFSCHISLASFNMETFASFFFMTLIIMKNRFLPTPFKNTLFLISCLSYLSSWLDWSHAFSIALLVFCSPWHIISGDTECLCPPLVVMILIILWRITLKPANMLLCLKIFHYLASIDNSCLIWSLLRWLQNDDFPMLPFISQFWYLFIDLFIIDKNSWIISPLFIMHYCT